MRGNDGRELFGMNPAPVLSCWVCQTTNRTPNLTQNLTLSMHRPLPSLPKLRMLLRRIGQSQGIKMTALA